MSRTKIIFIHMLAVAIVCAGGVGFCLSLGLQMHAREMLIAMLIGLGAAELAMIPVFVVRTKPADNVIQGALISMVIHIGVAAGFGLLVLQTGHPAKAFVYWLCAFYWVSLAGVCRVLLQIVKSAPVPTLQSPISSRPAGAGQASEV